MWVHWLDWAGPGQRQLADTCEYGNEPSGFLLKKDSAPCSKQVSKYYCNLT